MGVLRKIYKELLHLNNKNKEPSLKMGMEKHLSKDQMINKRFNIVSH